MKLVWFNQPFLSDQIKRGDRLSVYGVPKRARSGIQIESADWEKFEGAEDEESAGALALDERGIKNSDVVLGITASGRTPFVLGALVRAKSLGAKTILLTCNPAVVPTCRDDRRANVDAALSERRYSSAILDGNVPITS